MQPLSKNTLLLLIDLQKASDHPSWGERNNPDAEDNIKELFDAWRSLNMHIIHVEHMSKEPDSHYHPGQIGNTFKNIVEPRINEEILEKNLIAHLLERI